MVRASLVRVRNAEWGVRNADRFHFWHHLTRVCWTSAVQGENAEAGTGKG